MPKMGITGLKDVTLTPIVTNTAEKYETSATGQIAIPYVKSMTRTVKETSQDFYYDDDLYASAKDVTGEEFEMRFAEIPLKTLADLGLGEYDEDTNSLEANFNVIGKDYALNCVCNTISNLPYFLRWRQCTISSITFDNLNTRGDSLAICEAIVKGTFAKPLCTKAHPYVMRVATDAASITAGETWLKAAETITTTAA